MDLISVIVPVYKVESYLNRCIESIVSQTYNNLEIILVDDGSPDNCPVICEDWRKRDHRIRVVHKKNGGLSDARNAGMKVASGDYIGFVDSDDWIAPKMYEKLLEAINRDGSDIAACSVKMVWQDDKPDRMLTQSTNRVMSRLEAQLALLEEAELKQPVWYKLYRKEIIQKIPFEKGKYHEDVFWSYQAVGNANKVSVIDYVGYFYWQRTGSIMGENYSLRRLDAMEAYCNRYEYMKELFPELQQKALILLWEQCIYNGQMVLKHLEESESKVAFHQLNNILKKYPIKHSDYQRGRLPHRVWITIAKVSLIFACKLKNVLKIGM